MINVHKHKKAARLRLLFAAMKIYAHDYEKGEKESAALEFAFF